MMARNLSLLFALFLCLPVLADNIEQIVPPKEEGQKQSGKSDNAFLPGLVNVGTCWLEVPRAFSYEATAQPRTMIILSPVLGVSFTAMRLAHGAANILTLGLCDKYVRGDVPEYVWDSLWISRKPESD